MSGTTRHDLSRLRDIRAVLVGASTAGGVVTFALSFNGLHDYGRHVMELPAYLAPLVPVGVDFLTVVAVASTFALRRAPWHVRVYAWFAFCVTLAASVAGNLSHAWHRHLPTDGQVGAALAPGLLALASHLVVVTWRHLERQTPTRVTPAKPVPVAAATKPRTGVVEKVNGKDDKRTRALTLIDSGMTQKDAAKKVGTSERTVARWFADSKKQTPDAAPAAN